MDVERLHVLAGAVALRPHDAGAEPVRALGRDHVVLAFDRDGVAATVVVSVVGKPR